MITLNDFCEGLRKRSSVGKFEQFGKMQPSESDLRKAAARKAIEDRQEEKRLAAEFEL